MKKMLVFDVETTGLDYRTSQIIEFGGLLVDENGELVKEISTFVQCPHPLPEKIKEITNITDEMLLDGMKEEELASMLNDLIDEDTTLVAYNVQFDMGFLITLLRRFGYPFKQNDMLDCMVIYKERHPYPHRLFNAIQTYQLDAVNSHRALDDAKATLKLLYKMNAEQDVEPFRNRISYNSKYGLNGIRLDYVEYYPYKYKKRY